MENSKASVEFNSAAVCMGYRYLAQLRDGRHVWVKPFGNVCTRIVVEPGMADIYLESMCWLCDRENATVDEDGCERIPFKAGLYSQRSIKEYGVCIPEGTYGAFLSFIMWAEYETNVVSAMSCNPDTGKNNFAFNRFTDPMEQICIEY